jgi:PadR family transcriptional regulator PadR
MCTARFMLSTMATKAVEKSVAKAIEIRPAILLVLLKEPEAYGLRILELIEERSNRKLTFAQGVLYPALRALEREGLLKSRDGEPLPERGGRPRVYYKLTAEGRRVATTNEEAVRSFFLNPVLSS